MKNFVQSPRLTGEGAAWSAPFSLRCRRRCPPQAIVDRGAETLRRHRRYRDPRLGRSVGIVKQVEQPRGGFDEVARRAEVRVALNAPKPIRYSSLTALDRVEPQRLRRRIMARELAGRFDLSIPIAARHRPRSVPASAGAAARRSRRRWSIRCPRSVAPPSMISGMRPPRLFSTCSARVGLIDPLALADGAASGLPRRAAAPASPDAPARAGRSSEARPSRARQCRNPARSGTTSVSGPGQCSLASVRASSSNSPIARRRRRSARGRSAD